MRAKRSRPKNAGSSAKPGVKSKNVPNQSKLSPDVTSEESQRMINNLFDIFRQYEIDQICNPVGPESMVIDAPAGYGKTFLLQKAQGILQNQGWICAFVDLSKHQSPSDFIKVVALTTTGKELITDDVGRLAGLLAGMEKNAFLLLDTVDQGGKYIEWLRDDLVPGLRKRLKNINIKLRVVFAGRYIARYDWPDCFVLELAGIDDAMLQQVLLKLSRSNEWGTPLNFDLEQIEDMARRIKFISGGHPRIVGQILYEFIRFRGAVSLSDDQEKLFDKYSIGVIDEILENVPSDLRAILEILCIYRRFDVDTIISLQEAEKISPEGDALVMLGRLTQTGLLSLPNRDRLFYSCNSIIKNLLDAQTRIKFPHKHYVELNSFAMQTYEKWAEKTSDMMSKIGFLLEGLFHFVQCQDKAGIVESVETKLSQYASILRQAYGKQDVEILRIFKNMIDRDIEIYSRFQSLGVLQHITGILNQWLEETGLGDK